MSSIPMAVLLGSVSELAASYSGWHCHSRSSAKWDTSLIGTADLLPGTGSFSFWHHLKNIYFLKPGDLAMFPSSGSWSSYGPISDLLPPFLP
jgi:hypothetical protein